MPIDPLLLSLFVVATAGFIFTPGPIVSLIVAETLRDGPRHGIAVVFGAIVVSVLYLSINLFGFASVAALPDTALDTIRYAGALYLYYLAYKAFTEKVTAAALKENELPPKAAAPFASFRKSVLISLTSPKTILFFAAFFPQFVSEKLPLTPQLVILSATFLLISFLLDMTWVLVAAKAKKMLSESDKLTLANKIAGGVLSAGATILLIIN